MAQAELTPEDCERVKHMVRIAELASMSDEGLAQLDLDPDTLVEIDMYLDAHGV